MGNILACLCMGFRPFNTSVHHVPCRIWWLIRRRLFSMKKSDCPIRKLIIPAGRSKEIKCYTYLMGENQLLWWGRAAVLMGKISCSDGEDQLFWWGGSAVLMGKISCSDGEDQLVWWGGSAVLMGKISCSDGDGQLFWWGVPVILMGKISCSDGEDQLFW